MDYDSVVLKAISTLLAFALTAIGFYERIWNEDKAEAAYYFSLAALMLLFNVH